MNSEPSVDVVVRVARARRLTTPQAGTLRGVAASHALDRRALSEQELIAAAQLLAGRIDFGTYRRSLHV